MNQSQATISVDGKLLELSPKPFHILSLLISHAPDCVSIDTILAEVWQGRSTEKSVVKQHIQIIRKHLHETPLLLVSKRGFGYQLTQKPQATSLQWLDKSRWHRSAYALVLLVLVIFGFTYLSGIKGKQGCSKCALPLNVAVYPFINDGQVLLETQQLIQDEIIQLLTQQSQVVVLAMSQTQGSLSPVQLSDQFSIDLVFEGSIAVVEEKLKINVRMVWAHESKIVWSDTLLFPSNTDDITLAETFSSIVNVIKAKVQYLARQS